MHRPSSLPGLAKCPSFVSAPSPYFSQGTTRHDKLPELIGSDPDEWEFLVADMDSETAEGMIWAAHIIRSRIPEGVKPAVEKRLRWPCPWKEGAERAGTPDIVMPGTIIDLKWREANYDAQMADYSLGVMANYGCDTVEVLVLFASDKRVQNLTFNYKSARDIVATILADAETGEMRPGGQCSRCAKITTCPAVIQRLEVVRAANKDWDLAPGPVTFISDAKSLGAALRLAKLVGKWAEAVEDHAKFMRKNGVIPEGFELRPRSGSRFIKDNTAAVELLGLSQGELFDASRVSMSVFAEAYKKKTGLGKTAAEREMMAKLAAKELLGQAEGTQILTEKT